MRLSRFIPQNLDLILRDWDAFASAIQPPNQALQQVDLRDHAEEMLREIARELAHAEQSNDPLVPLWSLAGHSGENVPETIAETHAAQRLLCGFSIDQLVAEYCALRTNVLFLWGQRNKSATWFEVEDINHFNRIIDQALHQSVAHYSSRVERARDLLIGVLGHDIRTPLNAISMGIETLMRDQSLESRHIQLAARMFNSSERISNLVSSLLDFTGARFGMRLSRSPANLGRLAQQIVEESRIAHPGRILLIEEKGDLEGDWDASRISQVLSNLVSNALQHGAADGTVSLSVSGAENEVACSVYNEGNPIPAEEIGHIFEPLRRYDRTARQEQRSHANLGLGLYIAHEIVVAHGGTIEVASSLQEGTRFTVRLPRRVPAEAAPTP